MEDSFAIGLVFEFIDIFEKSEKKRHRFFRIKSKCKQPKEKVNRLVKRNIMQKKIRLHNYIHSILTNGNKGISAYNWR